MAMGKGWTARGSARAVACICCMVASMAGVSAWGQQALSFVESAPGFQAVMPYQNFGNGEHINIGNGGLTVIHPSAISLPQNMGQVLRPTRVYNSKNPNLPFGVDIDDNFNYQADLPYGPLGMGWQLNYGRVFFRMGEADVPNTGAGAEGTTEKISLCFYYYQDESGAEHELYLKGGTENYTGPGSSSQNPNDYPCANSPVAGTWYVTNDGSYLRALFTGGANGGTWTIYYPDGSTRVAGGANAYFQPIPNAAAGTVHQNGDGTYWYQAGLQNMRTNGWYVTSIKDIAGNTITLSYLAANSPGYPGYNKAGALVLPGSINQITDEFNVSTRAVTFHYSQGLLSSISAYGYGGQALTESYTYTTGIFGNHNESLPLLQEVTTPDDLQTVYGYTAVTDDAGVPWMLLSQIGYPTGAVSSYTYGTWSFEWRVPAAIFEATGQWQSKGETEVAVTSHTITLAPLNLPEGSGGLGSPNNSLTWTYQYYGNNPSANPPENYYLNYLNRSVNDQPIMSMPVLVTDPLGTQEAHFIAFGDLDSSVSTLVPAGHEIAVIRYAQGTVFDPSSATSVENGRIFEKDLYYSSGFGVHDNERMGDAGFCGDYTGGAALTPLDIIPNSNPRIWKVVETEYTPASGSPGTPQWSRTTRHAFWDGFGHYLVTEVGQTADLTGTGSSTYPVMRVTVSQYALQTEGKTSYQTNELVQQYTGGNMSAGPFPAVNAPPAGTTSLALLQTQVPDSEDQATESSSGTYSISEPTGGGGGLRAISYTYTTTGLLASKIEYEAVQHSVTAGWTPATSTSSWSWNISPPQSPSPENEGGDVTTSYNYDPNGNISQLEYSQTGDSYTMIFDWTDGVVSSLQWSRSGWPAGLWTRKIDQYSSLIRSQTDICTSGGLTTSYAYDSADRLSIIAPPGEYPVNIAYPPTTTSQSIGKVHQWNIEHVIEYYKGQHAISSGTVTALPPDESQLATPSNFGPQDLYSQYTFDGLGRLWKTDTVRPDGGWREQVTLYDPLGRKLFASLPYDPASSPGIRTITYPLASGSAFTFGVPMGTSGNALGTWDMIQSGNPLSGWGTLDPFYRTVEVIRPDGSTTTTTYASQLDWTTTINGVGGGGQSSGMEYTKDILGELLTATPVQAASIGASGTYSYDGLGHLTNVSLSGQTRSYQYDALGHLLSQTNPETGTITYGSYDALGNLLSYTDANGNAISEAYDFMGRRTSVSSNGQTLATWSYDGGGSGPYDRLTGTETTASPLATPPPFGNGGTVTEAFTYDPATGRIAGKSVSFSLGSQIPAESYSLSYGYDLMGNLATEGVGGSSSFGYTLTSAYGHGGLLSKSFQDGQGVSAIQYFPSGALQSLAYTNGTTTSFAQDAVERLDGIAVAKGSSSLWSTGSYTYDGAGNILSIGSDSFTYDLLSRLTGATVNHRNPATEAAGSVQLTYGYDPWGNLTSRVAQVVNGNNMDPGSPNQTTFLGETNFTATYNASNQLQTLNNQPMPSGIYDANGNLTTEGNNILTYDPLNQVQQAVTPGSSQTPSYRDYYFYDASGERVASVHTTASTSQLNTVTYYARTGSQVLAEEHLALDGSTPADHVKAYLYVGSNLATSEEGDVGGAGGTYSISGTITLNGSGLSGVTVSAGTGGTATTDGNGNYTISNLANGTYTVTPSLSGYTFSPASASETVNGANITGVNFTAAVVTTTYSLSGTVTLNGSGLAGVTVTAGSYSASTNSTGAYTISGLGNGTFTVTPSLSGYTFSPASASETVNGANITGVNFTASAVIGTTTLFSDGFEGSAWSTAQVSGTAGAWTMVTSGANPGASPHGGSYMADFNSHTAAAGSETRLYTTSGFAIPSQAGAVVTLTFWMDHDTGFSSAGDEVQVQVSTNGGGTWTDVPNVVADGFFRVNGSTGWAEMSLDLTAYEGQSNVQLAFLGTSGQGEDIYLDDVTVVEGPSSGYSLSGTVTSGGAALSGVTVVAGIRVAWTGANGSYTILGLGNGTYGVTPSLVGDAFTPASATETISGANVTGVNFSGLSQGISGTITVNGSGQAGVMVTATGGGVTYSAKTASNGAYTMGGVPNGTYTVTPSLSGYTFSPASASVTVSGTYATVNFTATPPGNTYSISGTFTITGMPNPSGIPVTLSGAASVSTTTNTSGYYIFSGLANGSYTVTAGQPTGIVITYNKSSKAETINGANLTGVNFTGSVCTRCTSGTVALADGTPVAGVSVSAANASATTDQTGLYILQPPGNGQGNQQGVEGTIVPSLPGYRFTPGDRPCDSHHRTQQDFTAAPAGQGSVKTGAGLKAGSGKPGAARPQAGHPEGSFEASPLKDLGRGASTAVHGNLSGASYGVRPHGGPGPSPFGRAEACSGMDEGETAGMEAEAAPAEAVRTEAAALTNTAVYFYVWDQVGSVRVVTDGAGNLVVIHDYEPYGVEILPNNPTAMPTDALAGTHLYTGQERDADTGLDNFHFRSYASTMGRFLSPDNIPGTPLNPQSFNLYAYVHGNPVNYNDPTGHWAGGLPPQRYYNSDPFGGLNFAPTGGIFEPESLLDALMDNLPNPAQQANTQPAAQDKQDPQKPTAGQEGTKEASVSVTIEQVKANQHWGHAVIKVGGDTAVGLVPNSHAAAIAAVAGEAEAPGVSVPVPGHVEVSDAVRAESSVSLQVTPEQAKEMRAFITQSEHQPQSYDAVYHNCAHYVEEVLHAGGIAAPHDRTPGGLVADLRTLYPQGVTP